MSDTSPPTSAPPPAPTDSSPPPDSSSPPPESPPASPPASPPSNPTPPPASPPTSPPPATPPPASPPQAPSPPPPSPTPASPPPGSPPPAAPPPGNPPAPPTPPPPKSTPPPPSNRSPPPPSVPSPPSPPGTPSSPPPPSYLSPPPPYEPPPPASPSSSSSPSAGLIAGIAAGAVIGAAVLLGILFLIFKKRHRRRDYESFRGFYGPSPSPPPSAERYRPGQVQTSIFHSQQPPPSSPSWKVNNSAGSGSGSGHKPGFSPKNPPLSSVPPPAVAGGPFKYEDLESATNGFSDSNVLGQGGFGLVYKGVLSGKEVAIKKLKSGGGQGDREFRAEVEIISRVHHRNLVSLVGFCIHEDQRLLVYEYVPNKTLDFHLHGSGRPTLDWLRRWKIALGAAKGLAYLHEDCDPKIIHRDIKAANILLDYNFEPKVADFGLAKFVPTNMSHVSTRVMGTFGYVAPEYANSGKLTDRSDVYSYGVVLLELITGRKPVMASDPHMDQSLVNWARPLLSRAMTEEIYDQLIDPWLETNYDQYDMTRLIHCAAAAVRHSGKKRPRMGQIVRYLEGEISLEDLNAGMMPGNSEVKGNSTEQVALRRMAFGGIITEDYAESDRMSEYEQTSSSGGVNTEEIELRRINTKERSGEV